MDRREIILQRLETVLTSIIGVDSGIVSVARNLDKTSESQQPSVIIYDAHEMVDHMSLININRPVNAPVIVDMSPQIIISCRKTKSADDLGPKMNALRLAVCKAIMKDATLVTLMSPNGQITYEGCGTDLARGVTMEGEMGVNFCFHYPFIPEEL